MSKHDISAGTLAEALAMLIPCAHNGSTPMPELEGVVFHIEGQAATMYATDRFILGRYQLGYLTGDTADIRFTVPTATAKEWLKLAKSKGELGRDLPLILTIDDAGAVNGRIRVSLSDHDTEMGGPCVPVTGFRPAEILERRNAEQDAATEALGFRGDVLAKLAQMAKVAGTSKQPATVQFGLAGDRKAARFTVVGVDAFDGIAMPNRTGA